MTVSYLPLIKVQQQRHDFPVKDRYFASSIDILAAGKAARARLMGVVSNPERRGVVIDMPALAAPQKRFRGRKAPLDMLAPCSAKFLLVLAALRHGVTAREITGNGRKRNLVAARAEAIHLIYQHTTQSVTQVGRFIGRDHTSVLHALHKFGVSRTLGELQRLGRVRRDLMVISPSPGFAAGVMLTAPQIIGQVCEAYGVSELELRSSRRAERLVTARHEAMYRLSKELALTNPQIGQALGGKDPSLVYHAIRAHEVRMNAGGQ